MRHTLLAISTLLAACAGGPGPAPAPAPVLDPVGSYDFSMDFQGQIFNGVFTIEGEPGAYQGNAEADVGAARLIDIAVDGLTLTFIADSPQGPIMFELFFEGDEFAGDWAGMGTAGVITGTKRM